MENFNIHKDKNKGKVKMQDVVNPTPYKGKTYFQDGKKVIVPTQPKQVALDPIVDKPLIQEQKEREEYNAKIGDLDPLYTSFQPTQEVLIRLFMKDNLVSPAGIYRGNSEDKVPIEMAGASGATYYTEDVNTPFEWRSQAIVVAVPEHLANFCQPGDIMACIPPRSFCPFRGNQTIFDYIHSFVHPLSNRTLPPKDIKDPNFGYALFPMGELKGHLSRVNDDNKTDTKDTTEGPTE